MVDLPFEATDGSRDDLPSVLPSLHDNALYEM